MDAASRQGLDGVGAQSITESRPVSSGAGSNSRQPAVAGLSRGEQRSSNFRHTIPLRLRHSLLTTSILLMLPHLRTDVTVMTWVQVRRLKRWQTSRFRARRPVGDNRNWYRERSYTILPWCGGTNPEILPWRSPR